MHEWVFRLDPSAAEVALSTSFAKAWDVWQFVENNVRDAGYIRDVANSSKHVILTRNPSTSMSHVANTYIASSTLDGFGTLSDSLILSGGEAEARIQGEPGVSFDACAKGVFEFWESLVAKI
jgi:hypothetical protein